MSTRKYILDEHGEPVLEPDLFKWADWFESNAPCKVKWTDVNGVTISTVFLALDHTFTMEGPPILWETRIMSGPNEGTADRCGGTREQAEAMHAAVVKRVEEAQQNKPGRIFDLE
jgi:hypothetical protein